MPASPMELPFRMGQVLLENGAEISRVQETMERVARAYDIGGFDVYVLTNSIFATATQDGVSHSTTFRYVPGATVHLVNEIPDGGRILMQKAVEILPGDTPEVLQRRVMEQAEWVLLPQAAELLSQELSGR